jgi:hypothetical protein
MASLVEHFIATTHWWKRCHAFVGAPMKQMIRLCLMLCVALTAKPVLAWDAVSGASGRKMVTVTSITELETSASLSYTEVFDNGGLRFYCGTTTFASRTDTNRAGLIKLEVHPWAKGGKGTFKVSNLKPGTTYYFRFQGIYWGKGEGNYWASGSFKTTGSSAVFQRADNPLAPTHSVDRDAMGRRLNGASGVGFGSEGSKIAVP